MLRLLLTCPTLADSFLSDMVEVCEIQTVNEDSGVVWLDIVGLSLGYLKPKPGCLAFIDECLSYAIMDGRQPCGQFYVRFREAGEIEFEWQVPEEQILRRPASRLEAAENNCNWKPMYGPTLLFHEIEYKAGYLAINGDWEELAVKRYELPHMNFG